MSADNLNITSWATGHGWGTGYNLSVYEKSGSWVKEDIADTFEHYHNRNGLVTGINYAGPEFAHGAGGFSNLNPGDFTWAYPTQADLAYHASRGIDVIRLPIRWERLQPAFYAALRESEKNAITATLDAAAATGLKIMLDIHNYALIHYDDGNGIQNLTLIHGTNQATAYYDFLEKCVDAFGAHSAWHSIDIMNEPANVPRAAWETTSQQALTALRNHGYNGLIMIPLGFYSGAQDLPGSHSGGPWISDPQSNFWYEAHYYPENSHVGTFNGSYANEVATAQSQGYSAGGSGTFEWDGVTGGGNGGGGGGATEVPVAPTALVAQAISSSQIRLTWTDESTNEDGFYVERSTDGVVFSQIFTTAANAQLYVNDSLQSATLYYYRVRAYNNIGTSNYSQIVSATTDNEGSLGYDRSNLVYNPNFENNVTDNTSIESNLSTAATIYQDASDPYIGTYSAQVNVPADALTDNWRVKVIIQDDTKITWTAGTEYLISFWIRSSDSREFTLVFEESGGVGEYPFGGQGTSAAWTRYNFQYTPVTTAQRYMALAINDGNAGTFNVGAVLVETGSPGYGTYFDGDYGTGYSWSGAPHNSRSDYDASEAGGGGTNPAPDYAISLGAPSGLPPFIIGDVT